ncbi:MAG: hypothetical protein IT308_12165 [Anaerolineaceae bacterium]|nr:hypothetical protein [Anaerolineaceae bacterium]
MKQRSFRLIAVVFLFLTSLACALPFGAPPATDMPPTPNWTMTALFSSGILGSLTPEPEEKIEETSISTLPPTLTLTPEVIAPTLTETPAPTFTIAPTTAVPPTAAPVRPGPVALAYFTNQPPVLDGNWDDFKPVEYGAGYVTYGAASWSGAQDLSSSFRLEWDNQFFYVAARVIDDVYVQNSTGNYLYLGDSLEILLDTDLYGDFYANQLTEDDFQLGISPGLYGVSGVKEAYLWYPRSVRGTRTQVVAASTAIAGGYQVEAAIPWGVFNLVPAEGDHYGFAFSVSDNDKTGTSIQQSMVSNNANRHLTMPMTWGELVLIR